jgi:phospholipase/carboxylesterase
MLMGRRAFLGVTGIGGGLVYQGANSGAFGQNLPQPAPAVSAEALTPGQHALGFANGRDGLIYVPQGYKRENPAPLVVMLHGAGGSAYSAISRFPLADEFGFVMLAPDSRDERTWDVLLGELGPDPEFIAAAIRYTFSRCAIDRQRVALAGSSDGATFALSYGVGSGDVFTHLIAFSPAIILPTHVRGKPRIFISHGTSDAVMPIDKTSRDIVRRLKTLGYDVTYQEFDGGHATPPAIAHDAFEWFRR